MMPKILIPLDDSASAKKTILEVIRNKHYFPNRVILLHVVDVGSMERLVPDIHKNMIYDAAKKSGKRILEDLSTQFRQAGFDPEPLLEIGPPAEVICRVAEERAVELLVIGRHQGGSGLYDVLFGSVANHVIHKVHCPLLLF